MLVRCQTDGALPTLRAAHHASLLSGQLDTDLKKRQETDVETMERRQREERESLEARYNLEKNGNAAAAAAAEARTFDPLSPRAPHGRPIGMSVPPLSPLHVNSPSAGMAAAHALVAGALSPEHPVILELREGLNHERTRAGGQQLAAARPDLC